MNSVMGYAQVGPMLKVCDENVDDDDTNCVTSLKVSEMVRCRLSMLV
jgi:hypothetical protein